MTILTMPTSLDHALSIISFFNHQNLAETTQILSTLNDSHPVFTAANALADAANSDDEAIRNAGLSALFGQFIEPLNDSFSPAGRAVYSRIFGHMIWRIAARDTLLSEALSLSGITSESILCDRHLRLRSTPPPLPSHVTNIVVLSRVTIGADILITSVALQALHLRWPLARIVLLGDGKLSGLFGGLPHVFVRPLSYARRGPLRDRLSTWLSVQEAVRSENADVVFAPDSRLDQLGLFPVCANDRYFLWENLQTEDQPVQSLADLYANWLTRTLGLPSAPRITPRVALDATAMTQHQLISSAIGSRPLCAVKLDHGGNPAKALPRLAEVTLLKYLRSLGWRILLDRGFGAEELANSDALLAELGATPVDIDDSNKGFGISVTQLAPHQLAEASLIRFHGSIAGWAAACACAGLAVSYDSVGHHLAAALGIPCVVAFTGYADPNFPIAWQPRGKNTTTVIAIPTLLKENPASWDALLTALPPPIL